MDAWSAMLMTLYAACAAAIVVGLYVAGTARIPRLLWRGAPAEPQTRTRFEGLGLLLIGGLMLLNTLAVDLGRQSQVRPYWVLLVWVGLMGGLLGIRYLVTERNDRERPRSTEPKRVGS